MGEGYSAFTSKLALIFATCAVAFAQIGIISKMKLSENIFPNLRYIGSSRKNLPNRHIRIIYSLDSIFWNVDWRIAHERVKVL